MIDLKKKIVIFKKKKNDILSDFNVQKYMSILCIIVLIILVGLDNNTCS